MFIEEIKNELENHIVPFWSKLKDEENGGFYGYMGNDLKLDKSADKGVILHSRILWFYSKCYSVLGDEKYRELADHAFDFIKKYCVDYENGGVYWMVDYKGNPVDTMKHTYNIAFAIYALSAYYIATGEKTALEIAYRLFDDIESNTLDQYGYQEAFSKDWRLIDNDALSENGLHADKTMNTILHLIEGYTELYIADKDEKVGERLRFLLGQMKDKVFDPSTNALKVFFDTKLQVIGDIHSFGHDIEATWLMDRACDALGDEALKKEFAEMNLKISHNIQKIALDNGALNNERDNDKVDKTRIWWVQAESVVGFINAYQHSGEEDFLKSAHTIWEYIKNYVVDKRADGEWHWEVGYDNKPGKSREIAGPWKCPYHNGRMCLEVIARDIEA